MAGTTVTTTVDGATNVLATGGGNVTIVNNGTINVAASANANGTVAATAFANATGIVQSAFATGTGAGAGVASISNAGAINVSAVANAFAPAAGTGTALPTGPLTGAALASATVLGVVQFAGGTASIINSGTLSVLASANAFGATERDRECKGDGVSRMLREHSTSPTAVPST